MIKILKKKEIVYPFSVYGHVKMDMECRQMKQAKITGVVGIMVILSMFALGFMSKEFVSMILISKGIGKVTTVLAG